MAKAIRSFLKLSKESPDLEILPGENKIFVDKDTINSRPIIMSAIVKGVDTGKDFEEKEKFNLPGRLNCQVTYTLMEMEIQIQTKNQ